MNASAASWIAAALVLAQGTGAGGGDLARDLSERTRAAYEVSGATRLDVVVTFRDEAFATIAFGDAEPDGSRRASLDGALHALLGIVAMQQADAGELDLEGSAGVGGGVTMHELLTHTSGLADWQDVARELEPSVRALPELIARLGTEGVIAPHGTCFRESSGDVLALAAVLQKSLGGPVLARVEKGVLARAGVADSGAKRRSRQASTIAAWLGERELHGTAMDLSLVMRALVARELTSERAWSQMTEADLLPDGTLTRFGHGLDLADLDGHERLAFGGAGGGASVQAAFYPAFDLTIALVAVGGEHDLERLERSLARAVFAAPEPEIRDLPLSADDALRFTGEFMIGCDRVEVRFDDGHLVISLPDREPLRLLRQAQDDFVGAAEHDLEVHFEGGEERADSFVLAERGWRVRARRLG